MIPCGSVCFNLIILFEQLLIKSMLRSFLQSLWALLLLVAVAQAQFQFFEHMFGGNQQQQAHHQGSQNVPSDSSRYQKLWAQCEFLLLWNCSMHMFLLAIVY